MKTKFLFLAALLIFATSAQAAPNPSKVVGSAECQDCHESETKAWKKTHHFKTFKELHRRPEAKKISSAMGIKRIKKDETCASCHYTTKGSEPVSGISCESCHGGAKDWIKIHNDYGGPSATKESESEAHRKQRWAKAEKAGMIRPDNLYELAENCYQCHTVPNEKLVNTGGHKPGSKFELVRWLQGEVRHNFASSEGKGNAEASPERKRMLYVVGRALDLEYGLRGVAKSTVAEKYAKKMAKRAKKAIKKLEKVQATQPIAEVAEMLKIAKGVKRKLNNEKNLLAAANKIAAQARKFVKNHDGSKLAAIDALLPPPSKYKGKPSS